MKTDRELLELAAKAAGHGVALCADGKYWRTETTGTDGVEHWNPLTDDGDALRLAISLELKVSFDSTRMAVGTRKGITVFHDTKGDIGAATRRAIVIAAAAIGEEMQ